jgi:hypothetical protein
LALRGCRVSAIGSPFTASRLQGEVADEGPT